MLKDSGFAQAVLRHLHCALWGGRRKKKGDSTGGRGHEPMGAEGKRNKRTRRQEVGGGVRRHRKQETRGTRGRQQEAGGTGGRKYEAEGIGGRWERGQEEG